MNKSRVSKILFLFSNSCLIIISIVSIIYLSISLITASYESKKVFNSLNNSYKACFGKNYIHDNSYFTDITCMKMEITSAIIKKSEQSKNQFYSIIDKDTNEKNYDNKNTSSIYQTDSFKTLKNDLANIQEFNTEIIINNSRLPLLNNCNSLYSSLNYMTNANDALLIDIINFINEHELLSIVTDKDIQQIHVMANISNNLVLNLNKQIFYFIYSILASLLLLLGTILNIYRLKRKKKYRKKRYNASVRHS